MGRTLNISISSGMGIRCRSRKNKGQAIQQNGWQACQSSRSMADKSAKKGGQEVRRVSFTLDF